jgi:Conserved TM helix
MLPAVRDWSEAMLTALAGGLAMFFAAIPKIIAFAVILVIGWFVAGLIARFAARLLRAVHFNDLAERGGFGTFVRNIGVKQDCAGFLAMIASWFMRLIVLVVAFDALGLPAVSDVLRQLLLWLPNLVVAVVVLVVGGLLANAAAGLVRGATASAGFGHPDVIANIARAAVWVFAVIVAVNQIGIARELVNTLFTGAVALAVIAFGLAFGLGGRDLAGNLLKRWYGEAQANAPKIQEAAQTAGEMAERRIGSGDRRMGGAGAPAHGYRDKESGKPF